MKFDVVGVLSQRRECIDTPNKFFLFGWFQRKHTILEARVKNNNTYSSNIQYKITEIVK